MQKHLPKSFTNYLGLFALFFIGLFVLWVRNPDPFANPIVYTEDGKWLGMAFTNGWLFTFWNAKDGYLVLGNLILLWIAETGSKVVCGNPLMYLPQSIGIVSLAFYSGIATFSFAATRDVALLAVRLLLFAVLLLLPLGDSSNEIVGRISNVGYMFVLLSVLLVSYREQQKNSTCVHIADVVLIIAAATNPVVILLLVIYFSWRLYQTGGRQWRQDIPLFSGIFLVGVLVAYRMLSQNHSEVTGTLQPENLVEVGIARVILYPLIFPYYRALSDFSTIAAFCVWIAFVMLAIWRSRGRPRLFLFYSAVALIIFWALTLFMRPSLTQQLGGYDHTFPDRYFMGINAIVLVITLVGASTLLRDSISITKIGALLVLTALVIVYGKSLPWILETHQTRMPLMTGVNFPDQLCASGRSLAMKDGPPIVVPTYFNGWSMPIPTQMLSVATQKLDCQGLKPLNINDLNWNHCIARRWAGFVMAASALPRSLQVGQSVRFASGKIRRINRIEVAGMYANVFLDGLPIDGMLDGYPNKLEVIE